MANKRIGGQTVRIDEDVRIIGAASVVGTKEGEGPLGSSFDYILEDDLWGEKSPEKAESKMQKEAITRALKKAGVSLADIQMVFAGDLLNQCIGTHYALRELELPFYGLYGACSTMAESLSLGAMMIDGQFADHVVCGTSSHFYSSERQYRLPIQYGGQRAPTAQWTVTGAGMAVLARGGEGARITHATTGKIVDKGIKDAGNMGAAMAPAAVDTIVAHFRDTGREPSYYDLILTGDLGALGAELAVEFAELEGIKLGGNYDDGGQMIFDINEQDMHCGGSGCGCSASVLAGHILPKIQNGQIKKLLFVGTGALMSPISTLQGESIPCIAHAVSIEE